MNHPICQRKIQLFTDVIELLLEISTYKTNNDKSLNFIGLWFYIYCKPKQYVYKFFNINLI